MHCPLRDCTGVASDRREFQGSELLHRDIELFKVLAIVERTTHRCRVQQHSVLFEGKPQSAGGTTSGGVTEEWKKRFIGVVIFLESQISGMLINTLLLANYRMFRARLVLVLGFL